MDATTTPMSQLASALRCCIGTNTEERKQAEHFMEQMIGQPGGLAMLQRCTHAEEIPGDLRQMAVIYLKNAIKKNWAEPPRGEDGQQQRKKTISISAEDKGLVKQGIMEMFPHAPLSVRVQFEECLRVIITEDFPAQWPELGHQLLAWLSSGNQQAVTAALRITRIVARKYEYRDDDDRLELNVIVEAIFPHVLSTFLSLVESRGSDSAELAELLKLCCKIYYSTTYMDIPPMLVNDQAQYEGWMNGLLALAEMRPHEQGMPQDAEGRVSWPWWKMKKWVYNIAYRLFSKYGTARVGSGKSADEMFGAKWNADYSMKFLHAVVHEMSVYGQGSYVTPRVANTLLNFLEEAIRKQSYWKELEPHMMQIVEQVVVPMLAFDDADQELWEEDPEEYIRKGYDIIEDIYSPKTAAVTVICELCSSKKKKQLDPIMNHLASILQEYNAAGQAVNKVLARKLDGALYAVGSLADILRKNPRYSSMIPGISQAYVLPLFASPYGHLRAKACWISSEFAEILYSSDDKEKNGLFIQLFERIQGCLGDPDLPVQVDAAIALREFFDAIDDDDSQRYVHALPGLLQKFLELANNVDSEGVMTTIESVVDRFSDKIGPYAFGVASALVQQFWRIVGTEENDQEEEFSDALAGHTVLATLATVLEAVSKSPEILAEMETLLFPIFDQFLSMNGMDIIEELLEIITYITYYSPSISPRMWSLYPKILDCMSSWGTDFFQDFVPVIDNYISRGLQVFLQSSDPPLLPMTNAMLEKALNQESDGFGTDEEVFLGSAAILQVILENCKGLIDQYIQPYMALIVSIMTKGDSDEGFEDPHVLENLLVAGADALYYNPVLTMNALQQNGQLAYFMHTLGQAVTKRRKKSGKLYHFASKRFKKIIILGLASVIATPATSMPHGIRESVPQIAAAATQLIIDLKKQEDARPTSSEYQTGTEGTSERYLSDSGDEEDDEDENIDDFMSRLRHARGTRITSAGCDDEDDFDFFDYSEDEEDDVTSPLDDVSPYTILGQACVSLRSHDSEIFMHAVQLLDGDGKSALEQLMSSV